MIEIISIKYSDNFIITELNTGESFKLTPEIFNMYSLSKGKIIENSLYQQLKEESIKINCRHKALNYLAIRSRSYHEIQNYLIKKEFSKNIIKEILDALQDNGYINDYDYAVRYINNRKKAKVVGRNILKSDLYKKGINKDIIRKAIKESGAEDTDHDAVFELAVKKLKTLENKKNKIPKIIYFLKQKGFTEDEVRKAIKRLKNEIEEEYI